MHPPSSLLRTGLVFFCTLGTVLAGGPARAAESGAPPDDGTFARIGQAWDSVTDADAWARTGHWRLALGPAAVHFRPSPEHRDVYALGVERQRPDNWLAGLSYFRNSFGQPSAYAYVGRRFEGLTDGAPQLFAQASLGVLYGYKGKYKNKVPLNYHGFSPGALIGLGWQFTPTVGAAVHLLGDAGMLFQLGWDFR
jgi:hypothetical protein